MSCSCSRCVGLIVLVIALLACCISFVAPYWVTWGKGYINKGLLGTCFGNLDTEDIGSTIENQCTWFTDNDFKWEKNLEGWEYACQAMFAFGLLLLLIAVPCACSSVCCDTYGRLARTTGSLVIMAAVFMSVAVIIYGVFMDKDHNIVPFYNQSSGKFTWGYYIGITGIIIDFIVGGLFLCSPEKY